MSDDDIFAGQKRIQTQDKRNIGIGWTFKWVLLTRKKYQMDSHLQWMAMEKKFDKGRYLTKCGDNNTFNQMEKKGLKQT